MNNILKKLKISRRGAFGVLFSLFIFVMATPFWVSALIIQDPYINTFSVDGKNGFYVGEKIDFLIRGGDKQDNVIEAELNYGNGAMYRFNLYKGNTYRKNYVYNNAGDFYPTLTLIDRSNRKKTFKLNIKIKNEWKPAIKIFKFDFESSVVLGDKIYLDYEIECKDKNDYKAQINWGDNKTETIDIICGPTIISHEYIKMGNYNIRLSLLDNGNNLITTRTLNTTINNEANIIGNHNPKARFFIKTTWPIVNKKVVFVDASTDPDGNNSLERWYWTFGDGTASNERSPQHIYTHAGRFKVIMTILDQSNRRDSEEQWIKVFNQRKNNLVKVWGSNKIYQIIKNQYHWIPTTDIFNDYGFKANNVKLINQAELNRYSRVRLVRVIGTQEIYYLTESNLKRKIPNMNVFYSYGNKLENVINISWKEFNWYQTNNLIKYDSDWRVYLLDNGQKRRIETADVFNRYGYDWTKIAPVNRQEINAYPTGTAIN